MLFVPTIIELSAFNVELVPPINEFSPVLLLLVPVITLFEALEAKVLYLPETLLFSPITEFVTPTTLLLLPVTSLSLPPTIEPLDDNISLLSPTIIELKVLLFTSFNVPETILEYVELSIVLFLPEDMLLSPFTLFSVPLLILLVP